MYVCLCLGVTSDTVSRAVGAGASTSKEVANMCGAGSQCGRCRRTVRAIIDSVSRRDAAP
jgi:bacterioferritin-associated ferredoxin